MRRGSKEVRRRDERDLARVDVALRQGRRSECADSALARIQHEFAPHLARDRSPDGRLPPRTPQARPVPVQRCGSLQRGEPCDTYEDYSLHQRCIVQGDGFPDTMFPAVYNANIRIVQSPGHVAITYELIHDTRVIPIDASPQRDTSCRPPSGCTWVRRAAAGRARRSSSRPANLRANTRGSSPALRLIERFTRAGRDS